MKYLFLLILLFVQAFAEQSKQKITLGVGPYVQTQPYTNVDPLLLPSPVLFFENGLFYVRWTRVGVYFLGEKNEDYAWGLSLTAQPRTYGFTSSDIQGMNERKTSWEGGLALSAKAGNAFIEISPLTDLLNQSQRWILNTEVGYELELGKFSFYPSIILSYQSSTFVDYYYGVTKSEASIIRHEYHAKDGLQLGLQTYINYQINNKFSVFTNIKVDKLSQEATKSPILNNDYIYSGLLSLLYTFEY